MTMTMSPRVISQPDFQISSYWDHSVENPDEHPHIYHGNKRKLIVRLEGVNQSVTYVRSGDYIGPPSHPPEIKPVGSLTAP